MDLSGEGFEGLKMVGVFPLGNTRPNSCRAGMQLLVGFKRAFFKMFGRFSSKILNKIKYRRLTPSNHKLEDIYLVSFPKSGNTWLRFLVANAFKQHLQIQQEVNFFSIHDIIPDVQISRNIRDVGIFGQSDLPRIIKSHSRFNPNYHRVILLVRDPRDALVSYYYFLRNYGGLPEEYKISEFIRSDRFGADVWSLHTQSWLSRASSNQNVQVILYEDLVASTAEVLSRVVEMIGFNVCSKDLSFAVELSSKEAMKRSEEKHRSYLAVNSQTTPFVRESKSLRRVELSSEDRSFIEARTRSAARLVGYDFTGANKSL